MLSEDTQNMASKKLELQFYEKIKYNFKLHVLLCLKGSNCNRHSVLQKIYLLEGYRCHRVAKYGTNWSHLHVKFDEEEQAKASLDFFKTEEVGLTAVLVDDLLRDWHSFEKRSDHRPPWTLAVIDVVGNTPHFLNFLAPRILNDILEDFGRPFLLPYTAALTETHVQVLFSSMTEALAACMAFGQWFRTGLRTDQFFYRVRISPSVKEAMLIRISGGVPEEALKLDYFLSDRRMHIRPSAGHARGSHAHPTTDKSAFHGRCRSKNTKAAGVCKKDIKDAEVCKKDIKAAEVCKKDFKATEVGVKTRKANDVVKATRPHEAVKIRPFTAVRPFNAVTKPGEVAKPIKAGDVVEAVEREDRDGKNQRCRSDASHVRDRPSPVVCLPLLTTPGVALQTMNSLHTAVFPTGFGEAFRCKSQASSIRAAEKPDTSVIEATEACGVFDCKQEFGSLSEVGFPAFFQQMTRQTMPSITTPNNYGGKTFECSEYTN